MHDAQYWKEKRGMRCIRSRRILLNALKMLFARRQRLIRYGINQGFPSFNRFNVRLAVSRAVEIRTLYKSFPLYVHTVKRIRAGKLCVFLWRWQSIFQVSDAVRELLALPFFRILHHYPLLNMRFKQPFTRLLELALPDGWFN